MQPRSACRALARKDKTSPQAVRSMLILFSVGMSLGFGNSCAHVQVHSIGQRGEVQADLSPQSSSGTDRQERMASSSPLSASLGSAINKRTI